MLKNKLFSSIIAFTFVCMFFIWGVIPVKLVRAASIITPDSFVLTDGEYYLTHDVTLNNSLFIKDGDVKIDLNGYTLRLKDGVVDSVICVRGGSLFLNGRGGKISGGKGNITIHGGNCRRDRKSVV